MTPRFTTKAQKGNLKSTAKLVIFLGLSVFLCTLAVRFFSPPLLQKYSFSQLIYSADHELLRVTLSGDQKYRFPTRLEDVPAEYVKELIAKEDKYFHYHFGFNPVSLMKAINDTYVLKTRRRGASTITMQLARLLSIDGSNSMIGKAKQLAFAVYLEVGYSKKQILEAYLTLTPYGRNIESLSAASFMYFAKPALQLNAKERQLLLALPQNPNSKNNRLPLIDRPFKAPHFTDRILEFTKSAVDTQLKIETPLNYKLQKKIELSLENYLRAKLKYGVNNAAILVARISTGEVISYIGSGDYFNADLFGQVNGVSSRRSPGSLLKPFLYARAIEQGLIHPQTLLKDLPTSFGLYDPENFDRAFRGPISATQSLVESRNVPAIQLLKNTTAFTEMIRHFGVKRMNTDEFYGLGAAIGGVEVTLEEVAAMYQQLSHAHEIPRLVFVATPRHELIFKNFKPYLSKEARFLTSQMLTENKMNEGLDRFRKDRSKVAWKTGTSYGYHDAWTAGLYDDYVIAVWIGNFSGEFNSYFKGRDVAAPLFFEVIDQIKMSFKPRFAVWNWKANIKVSEVDVCSLSGGMATKNCAHTRKTWFIPGQSPIDECQVHQKILINAKSGRRICPNSAGLNSAEVTAKVFEVWPSDLFSLFKKAGLYFKLPPDYESGCETSSSSLSSLQIIYPRKDIIQTISLKNPLNVYFKATAESSVKKLDWFVDGEYFGSNKPEESLQWTPKAGRFLLKVVDDRGFVDSQNLVVETVK